jgi:TolB-like protein/class 3 adenylate cyclase/Tfp pilus assembly protein PilF
MSGTRKIAAILAGDIVGYSRLAGTDEDRTLARLRGLRSDLIDPAIDAHHGHIVKRTGDGILIEFRSVVDAVRCAIEVQNGMIERNSGLPPERRIEFRVGIHLGDVVEESDGDLMGDGVNIAARLEGIAEPNGICISNSAYEQVRDKFKEEFVDLGEIELKNIARPVRAYRMRLDARPARLWFLVSPLRERRLGLAVLAAALLIIGGLWWIWAIDHRPTFGAPRVAVLPFDNLSADAANGRIADGITEDVITDLSRFSDFTVIARNSTEVYKGKPVDVRQIGKDLKVSHVLEGSYQREGDRVRITAQLIDATTGTHIWSERYDRSVGEVFEIQSDVADRIANSLGLTTGAVANSVLTAAKRKPPRDLGAYELVLLGREKMTKGLNVESQLEAEKLLEQAIQIDPSFAGAHVVLADSYFWRTTLESDTDALTKQMLHEAQVAVDLDPMDGGAHLALGFALNMRGESKQAEIQFDEALRLNPNSFDVLAQWSCAAHSFGRAQSGAQAVDRAMQLNPNYPTWAVECFRLGLLMVGRYKDILRNQAREPEDKWNQDGYVMTAGSLATLGRMDEAKALVARGVDKYPGQLSIEKFVLNRGWGEYAIPVLTDLMRKTGFPVCASDADLAGIAKPVRLSECAKTSAGQ